LEVLEHVSCNWITCGSSAVISNTIYCNNHTNNTGDTNNFNFRSSTNNYPSICTINVSGVTKLDNITTINSSFNVSGVTTLKNITTINSTYIIYVSGTTLNNDTTLNGMLSLKSNTWHQSIDNFPRLFFSSGG
jgi:hypothetical protein